MTLEQPNASIGKANDEHGQPGAFTDLNDEELQQAILESTRKLAELDPEFAEFAKQLAQQKRATKH